MELSFTETPLPRLEEKGINPLTQRYSTVALWHKYVIRPAAYVFNLMSKYG